MRKTEADDKLVELRKAALCGVADIEAGRFRTFRTRGDLARHLRAVTNQCVAFARRPNERRDL